MSGTLSEKVMTVVDVPMKRAIRRLAAKQQRSEGQIVRLALAAYIEKESK